MINLDMELTPQISLDWTRWSQTWRLTWGETYMGLDLEVQLDPQQVEHEYVAADGVRPPRQLAQS